MPLIYRVLFGVLAVGFGLAVLNLATVGTDRADRAALLQDTGAADPATDPEPQPVPDLVQQVGPIETAFRVWMVRNGIESGAMALALPDGTIIGRGAGRPPDATAPVASLSKAITGLCLNEILHERGLPWQTRLGDIAEEMSAAGLTPRPWNAHITLEALATHRAGLAPDLTQGELVGELHGALGLHLRIAREALAAEALSGTLGTHFYANTNYAVLGMVIEALSGQSYSEACLQRIIAPAGIEAAVIEGRMGSMSAYAGWEISAEDYARLAAHWFAGERRWMIDPATGAFDGQYAMGYVLEGRGEGAVVTHNGRICSDDVERNNIGATFVATGEGTAFAANWSGCIDRAAYTQLILEIGPLLR